MTPYNNPEFAQWESICKRPELNKQALEQTVNQILDTVKSKGDAALLAYAQSLDKVAISSVIASASELKAQAKLVPQELQGAIATAINNIKAFHNSQAEQSLPVETMAGISCWRKSLPIEKVGLYVPGGSAPLFSSLLMLAIPAKIAGCKDIVVCTPPDNKGLIPPAIAYCCLALGLTQVFKAGGAQAVGAMTFGTESIPQVYKIFGPGNQYVTKAKELVQQWGVAIDMPAGPSEVLVIADQSAQAEFVAADLLSQAEHGPDSQVVLVTNSQLLITQVNYAIRKQLDDLPRKAIAKEALKNSKLVYFDTMNTAMEFSNAYAPEHLILASDYAPALANQVTNAGSVFLGHYTPESAGDYASGTNHTLPTNGYARQYSGVSLDSFIKKITFQEISKKGIKNLGPTIEIMAEAEALIAHKNAVSVRLKNISND